MDTSLAVILEVTHRLDVPLGYINAVRLEFYLFFSDMKRTDGIYRQCRIHLGAPVAAILEVTHPVDASLAVYATSSA